MTSTLKAFWKFSRPHTIYGTAISLVGIFLIAVGPFTLRGLLALVVAELSCLCANVYIVGLNQITDIDIDRINKPYLPLASGEMSLKTATWLVGLLIVAALTLALAASPYLFGTVLLSLLIGTAYSLPPFRLKRFPLFASLCIFTVRGLVVNLGIYWYFRSLVGLPPRLDPAIVCLCLFVTVFTFVIALFKDIPDMEGDQRFNISTFSLRLGKQYVFDLCCGILVGNYLVILGLCGFTASLVNLPFLSAAHLIVVVVFVYQSRQVDLKSDVEIYDFYQFIWKLYYVEYLVLPLAWLLG